MEGGGELAGGRIPQVSGAPGGAAGGGGGGGGAGGAPPRPRRAAGGGRGGGWPHPTGECRRWCRGGEGAASRGAGGPPPAAEMIGCFLEGRYEQVTVGHASRSLVAGSPNDRRLLGRSQPFADQVDEETLSR